jgi:nucleoside triphosphatase
MQEVKRPNVTAGAMIQNGEGKFFLMQSPKWKNLYTIPGGHIEWGEKVEEALRREIKEETNLSIYDIKLLRIAEFIEDSDYNKNKHIVSLNFVARTDDKDEVVKLEEKEGTSFVWMSEEEIEKRDDVHKSIKENIEIFREKFKGQDKVEEYKIGWQRALADYANLQKETARRQQEWVKYSEQQILEEFIPVYDHFKVAFAHHPELNCDQKNIKNWIDGIGYIMKQFGDVMKAHGVEEIKTVGQKFDPRFHETAGEEEGEGEHGTIVKEVTGGYKMGEKVIKPARVIIRK